MTKLLIEWNWGDKRIKTNLDTETPTYQIIYILATLIKNFAGGFAFKMPCKKKKR